MKTHQNHHKTIVHPSSIHLLTNATWEFAHSILWDNFHFFNYEVELAKIYIREFYESIPAEKFSATAHRYFAEYCERVLLAKAYVDRYPSRYIPHPCIWLNKTNPKGFAGTKNWYYQNLEKRKAMHSCQPAYPVCACCGSGQSSNSIFNHFHYKANKI